MSAYEQRAALLQLADRLNQERLAIAKTISEINEATALLVNKADELLPLAVTEKEEGKTVTKLTIAVNPQLEHVASQANKRNCSNPWCGQAGHNKRTCPTPRPAEPMGKAPKAIKKKRTVSPERAEQLRAQLAVARTKRGKK